MIQEFHHLVVLGAAGKMGCGIALLLLQEIADNPQPHRQQLTLLDTSFELFPALISYLKEHLTKHAERTINTLRSRYANSPTLIDNRDIIEYYTSQALDQIQCTTSFETCQGANLVFEAVNEIAELKIDVFRKAALYADKNAWFLTNTSSIPISFLEDRCGLHSRMIGFHFYNPPAMQKLIEIIPPEGVDDKLKAAAIALAKQFKKIAVFSHDIAGFIGNGYFIREILFACNMIRELEQSMSTQDAIMTINKVSQDLLIRPMGLFQLIDFVGIEVCQRIASTMTAFLPGRSFIDPFMDMIRSTRMGGGGQNANGSQKEGFFCYEKGKPSHFFSFKEFRYEPLTPEVLSVIDQKLERTQDDIPSWKALVNDPQKQKKLTAYFRLLGQKKTLGTSLAWAFLTNTKDTAYQLVGDGVADTIDDVNTVLQHGFFHLYPVDLPFTSASY